jgi:hypothetical protein
MSASWLGHPTPPAGVRHQYEGRVCHGGLRVRRAGFSVSRALQLGLPAVLPAIEEISDQAGREFSLERSLDKMQADWAGIAFETIQWRSTGERGLHPSCCCWKLGLGLALQRTSSCTTSHFA